MKNYKFLYLILLIFLGLTLFLSVKSRINFKNYDNLRIEMQQFKQKLQESTKEANLRFGNKLFTENTFVENIYLTDLHGDTVQLRKVITSPKLIFRFSNEFCRACVDADIESLKDLGNIIGNQNIIIVTDNENARLLNIFRSSSGIESPCYNLKGTFNLSIENSLNKKQVPFLFILDENLEVHFSFFADEASELNEIYFNRIIKYFKKGP